MGCRPDSSSSSGGGLIPPSLGGSTSSGPGLSGPTIAKGNIVGLAGGGNSDLELRLRPQANGFLHGELTIHKSGFGATPIEGFVRGNHLQFTVPYGTDTYYFEGEDQRRRSFRNLRVGTLRAARHLDRARLLKVASATVLLD